ncbi:futalosine hydrolase [Pelovirga terrestris]|uniref:Futalosine hydrolase n=1 Tax=Pelovirga terrestris TaxID=2771352 RepID=A0A8J6QV65_9BACT|nr:futalosine hydrolase [Pelovirga terrestris]MBD1401300.1 futalosine hydrolase [Pelovirga terrestris]
MVLVLAATPAETALLRRQVISSATVQCGGRELLRGNLCGTAVVVGHAGIGAMLMAMQLTRMLTELRPAAVILCGCGGSYPDRGPGIGDLALASSEIYGDCGVTTDSGFIPLEQLKIPQQSHLAPLFQQSYKLDTPLYHQAVQLLPQAYCGPFVTVNNCSGTPELSRQLQRLTTGICENMEGAAAAQVCAEFACPLLEVRGISNPTGTRADEQWDIPLGMRVAQEAVLTLLQRGLLNP